MQRRQRHATPGSGGEPAGDRTGRRPGRCSTARASSSCASRPTAGASTRSCTSAATARAAAAADGTSAPRASSSTTSSPKVRAGVWRKRQPPPPVPKRGVPTFHEYASDWLAGQARRRPRRPADLAQHRAGLPLAAVPTTCCHSSANTASTRSTPSCASRSRPTRSRRPPSCGARSRPAPSSRTARAGAVRPLSPAMIRKLTACLTTILDEAVDDGHLERNPARSRRMRVKVPKPPRTFLEMDELVALTDAAGEQDAELARPKLPAKPAPGSTAAKVAERWLAGKRAFEIADELGLAKRDRHLPPAPHAGRRRPATTSAAARSSPPSAAPGCASASCATSASATCACTPRAARTSASPTPRPKPASATSRSAPTCSKRSSVTSTGCAAPDSPRTPTPTCSPTAAADG